MSISGNLRWSVLGTGNIGRILALRLRVLGVPGENLTLYDPDGTRRDSVAAETGSRACAGAAAAAENADFLLLAIPPKAVVPLMKELAPGLHPGQTVVSFAAGLPIDRLAGLVPAGVAVVRVMPNAPSLVGRGMNPVVFEASASPDLRARLKPFLAALGDWIEVRDDQMNWCVGLAGAAMRSVLPALEGMVRAGLEAGLSEEESRCVAGKVVQGTGAFLCQTSLSFEEIKSLTPMQTVDEVAVANLFYQAALEAREKVDRVQSRLLEA